MMTFLHSSRVPLALELVVFPLAVSIRQEGRITIALLLILLVISTGRYVSSRNSRAPERLNLVPIALLMLCILLVFWRGPLRSLEIYVMAAAVLVNTARWVTRKTAYASLLAGLTIYLFGNVAGWLLGIQSASTAIRIGEFETSETLFSSIRVFFPFAQSINEPAWVATSLIVAVAAMIAVRQKPMWYHWAGVIAGLIVVLASNNRTAALLALPALTFTLIAPRLTRQLAPYAVGIAMCFPFLLGKVQPIINWVATFVASNSYFARGQSVEQIVGLSSRGLIWNHSIDYWRDFVTDGTDQLFGYGFEGHAASGALASYTDGGVDYLADPTALTMHNSLLQTLFDGGLVGASILLGVTVFTVSRYRRDIALLPMLAVTVMVGLSATMEATLAPGFSDTPTFLLLYLAVFIPRNQISPKKQVPVNRRIESERGPTQILGADWE